MMLDNLAIFASFVSVYANKDFTLAGKKDNKYDTDDNYKLRQEFEMWMSKTFLSSSMDVHTTSRKPTPTIWAILTVSFLCRNRISHV